MCYKSSISKTEKKKKSEGRKQAWSHYLICYTGPTKPRALDISVPPLCSVLTTLVTWPFSRIAQTSAPPVPGCVLAPPGMFQRHSLTACLKVPTHNLHSHFYPFPKFIFLHGSQLSSSGIFSKHECSVYCSVSRPCYSIQHKARPLVPLCLSVSLFG